MKTIQISDEMYEELMNISKELNNQDHRATRMPYIYQIEQPHRENCQEWYEDWFLLIDSESDHEEVDTTSVETIIEYLKENESNKYDYLKEKIDEIIESNKDYKNYNFSLEEIIDLLIDELWMTKWYYKEKYTYENAFFTEKWVKEHIEQNDYHYHKEVDNYLTYLNRNPEMETVMKFLCELSWWKLHT